MLMKIAVAGAAAVAAANKILDGIILIQNGVKAQNGKEEFRAVTIDMVITDSEFEQIRKSDAWHIIERGARLGEIMKQSGDISTCGQCGHFKQE